MLREKIAIWSDGKEAEEVPGEEVVSMQAAAVQPSG